MGDIYLSHSASGSSWQKKGAKYISRVRKNGKWVYQYAKNTANGVANKVTGVNPNYASSKNGLPHELKTAVWFPLDKEGKAVVDKKAANYNKALIRTTSSKNLSLQKAARKRKIRAVGINAQQTVQRNILKGKKKVAEILSQIQRQYEGKKAGRKSAKLSKERQKRHKQNNTIKLNNKQRVTFSEVKLSRRK